MGISVAVALGVASGVHAQTPADPAPAQATAPGTLVIPKDPVVAMYLSATLPGLGQIYAGKKTRGVLFMASVLGAFGGAYAAYELAHALTAPDQPYLLQMAVLAARLGDRHALDAACTVLMERSPPPAGASALCVPSGAGAAGAAAVPGLGGLLGSDAGSGATGP